MINKKKAPNMRALDPNLIRVINTIYDDINSIIDSVNTQVKENRKEYLGKVGDIRVLKDNTSNTYKIQARTEDGWASANLSLEEGS